MPTAPARQPSVTSWQKERDALLDQIALLQDSRDRATDFLTQLAAGADRITTFDVGEAVSILWETVDQRNARLWPQGVLHSEPVTHKEDQQ